MIDSLEILEKKLSNGNNEDAILALESLAASKSLNSPTFSSKMPALHILVKRNDLSLVKKAISLGADVNTLDGEAKATALHFALTSNTAFEIVTELAKTIDLSIRAQSLDDSKGMTPTRLAAFFFNFKALNLFYPKDSTDMPSIKYLCEGGLSFDKSEQAEEFGKYIANRLAKLEKPNYGAADEIIFEHERARCAELANNNSESKLASFINSITSNDIKAIRQNRLTAAPFANGNGPASASASSSLNSSLSHFNDILKEYVSAAVTVPTKIREKTFEEYTPDEIRAMMNM